jgi:flagellar export protein FliJ
MKRFTFRLERVLRITRQRERQAELSQQHAKSQLNLATIQLTAAREHLNSQAAALANGSGHPCSPSSRIGALQYLGQLHRQVELAEAHARKAEGLLNEAIVKRAAIHREVESLGSLRRNQWHEHRREATQAAQVQLDELSMRRWQSSTAADPFAIKEVAGS